MLTCVNLDLFVKLGGGRGINRNGMFELRGERAAEGERLCGGLEIQYGQDGRTVATEACYW